MASRQAGTLQTTTQATYTPPGIAPGYTGYIPKSVNAYGETYGHKTQRYFQDVRNHTLKTSKSMYCRGGYFPTYTTHNPELVISRRNVDADRWAALPKDIPTNVDHNRQLDIQQFAQKVQKHRDYYSDWSQTAQKESTFVIPLPMCEALEKRPAKTGEHIG